MNLSPRGLAFIEKHSKPHVPDPNDLRVAESAVNSLVSVPLDQNQFDALVSFTFGEASRLVGTKLLEFLNSGDYEGAADDFPNWCRITGDRISKSLLARRNAERALFRDVKEPDTDPELVK